MRIGPIYITYNTHTLLAHSSNSKCPKFSELNPQFLKVVEIRINISINPEISNYQYHYRLQLYVIAIIRNISRSKLIIFSRENYLNRLIPRLNSR